MSLNINMRVSLIVYKSKDTLIHFEKKYILLIVKYLLWSLFKINIILIQNLEMKMRMLMIWSARILLLQLLTQN